MRNSSDGFSLIEVIVIIVLAGIAAAVMVPFLGSALTRSHEPIDNLRRAAGLSSQMARVLADYNSSYDDPECGDLLDWDIEFNPDQVELDSKELCYFDKDSAGDGEDPYILSCDEEGDPEVLQVRLRCTENAGEVLTYLFPCNPE